jgi:hypothetical protein
MPIKPLDITGQKHGMLTALRFLESRRNGRDMVRIWLFVCECGKQVEYPIGPVRAGRNISCGCRLLIKRKGKDSPRWRGGVLKRNGYTMISDPSHPNCDSLGYVREHVKVMSKMLGRPLLRGETVHHKNGLRSDNRPENLELWRSQPSGQRVSDLLAWAKQIIDTYGKHEFLQSGESAND